MTKKSPIREDDKAPSDKAPCDAGCPPSTLDAGFLGPNLTQVSPSVDLGLGVRGRGRARGIGRIQMHLRLEWF